MDLTAAEGVAATISAQSAREAGAARQLLAGELARRVRPIMDALAQGLALTEVGIDFSDEEVTLISAAELALRCRAGVESIEKLLRESARFERLTHEPRIVLVGRPNAGKSTLLNALAGRERAVVSEVAGTTRDALGANVRLARGVVQVVDVAGIEERSQKPEARSQKEQSVESIERQMRERALREMETADLVVLVHDALGGMAPPELSRLPDLVVCTKLDLGPRSQMGDCVHVSAVTGDGINELHRQLDVLAFGRDEGASGALPLNARHVRALEEARDALVRAADAVAAGPELAALELRGALESLGNIVGQLSPDELLGRIFSQFCIGK
jgi:tRNA modification GTPase